MILPYNGGANTSMIHNCIDDVNVNCNQLNTPILNDVELIHRNRIQNTY
jgi:hypothetical protein